MKLTLKQRTFCRYFLSDELWGNASMAYAKAYGYDLTSSKENPTVRVNSSRLLTNANISQEINRLLKEMGFNHAEMDKNLLFVAMQTVDLEAKVMAIKLYNDITRSRKKPLLFTKEFLIRIVEKNAIETS